MSDVAEKLQSLRRELREEYLQPHDWPWKIGFSGGKAFDQFVFETVCGSGGACRGVGMSRSSRA
jgi:hypothetical protein